MTKNLCIFPYGLKFSHITRATLDAFGKCGIVYAPVFDALTAQFPELGRKPAPLAFAALPRACQRRVPRPRYD